MKLLTIDLYEYFKLPKPKLGSGVLSCYIKENPHQEKIRTNPGILVIPGGGYQHVSLREGELVALKFLANGYNAFVLNYTVYPNGYYPTQLIEAAMAMIYLRKEFQQLSLNPDMIAALGFSAGGHLCGSLGIMFEDHHIMQTFPNDYLLVRPNAILLGYPVISINVETHRGTFENVTNHDPELMKYLSLETHVNASSAPAFIWHTADDSAVPVINSLILAEYYSRYHIPFELHIFEKGFHGSSIAEREAFTFDPSSDNFSAHLKDWPELAISWLKERGFTIIDK